MFNLDPGKLLVIAVVAIILLGPDRLPHVARQVGGAWRSFNEFRHRVETQVRDTVPDLPPTSEIARLARSPAALLNHLSNLTTEPTPVPGVEGRASTPDVGTPPDTGTPIPANHAEGSVPSPHRPAEGSAAAPPSSGGTPGLPTGTAGPGDPALN